jgi:hypothetical protein
MASFNDFPANWREITQEVFAKSRHFTFAPVNIEFRQMIDRNDRSKPPLNARLEWQADGTGYSIVNDYWAGTVKLFAFGERTPGLVENFDSSD